MPLLLDIGNSAVKWAVCQRDVFDSTGLFNYSAETIEQDIEKHLSILEKPDSIFVSNVAGNEVFKSLNAWVMEQWQQECRQPSVTKEYKGLKNSYPDTKQMGLDRWLSMIASWETYQSALCLVSCGTAMTIDLIGKDGNHNGGYIIPGIELMQKALINNTVQINSEIKKNPSIDCARDTQTAINNGAFIATVSAINEVIDRFRTESNVDITCIITGGMASSIQPLLKHSFYYEPNLVLKGLSLFYRVR